MSRKTFYLAILLLILLQGACLGQPQKQIGAITLDDGLYPAVNYSLGQLTEGQSYDYSIAVTNGFTSPVKIRGIKETCECIKITYPLSSVTIPPGAQDSIRLEFDTTGEKDAITKFVYIYTDIPQAQVIKLQFDAFISVKQEKIVERFKSFSIGTIAAAGLLDGINPCAFTVLVFFMSFLSFVGYDRRQAVFMGLTFLLAVFLTYTLIGLGIFQFLHQLEAFKSFSKALSMLIAGLAFFLAGMNIYDYFIFKKTHDPHKIKLKLPGLVRRHIDTIIKNHTKRKAENKQLSTLLLLPSVFVCGFLVSLLESVCTGQVYLPTIAYIMEVPALRNKSLMYLIFYNIVFVIPLFAVLCLAVAGLSSEHFGKFVRGHLGKIKILTAVLFLALGATILFIK